MGFLTKNERDSFILEISPQMAKRAVQEALDRLGLPLSEDAGLALLYAERFKLVGNPAEIEIHLKPAGSTSTTVHIEVRRMGIDVRPKVATLLSDVREATCQAAAPVVEAARATRQAEEARAQKAAERARIEASPGHARLRRLQEIENHRPLSTEEQTEFQRLQDEHAKVTSGAVGTSSGLAVASAPAAQHLAQPVPSPGGSLLAPPQPPQPPQPSEPAPVALVLCVRCSRQVLATATKVTAEGPVCGVCVDGGPVVPAQGAAPAEGTGLRSGDRQSIATSGIIGGVCGALALSALFSFLGGKWVWPWETFGQFVDMQRDAQKLPECCKPIANYFVLVGIGLLLAFVLGGVTIGMRAAGGSLRSRK